jgi:hypothetical protein
MYYVIAKGRFGYFRCIGRNAGRTRCSQARYVPAVKLEQEVEALYEAVRIPAALRRRLERVLRTEVAERERHRAEATESLGRRLRQLANEREKLLRAYYADAIDVATLKREQARINADVAETESQLATDGEKLKQAKQIIDLALDLAKDCASSYGKARPDARKMWNRAFFRTIRVRDSRIADFTYEEPFASLLGSHKGSMVEVRGFEPGRRPGYSSRLVAHLCAPEMARLLAQEGRVESHSVVHQMRDGFATKTKHAIDATEQVSRAPLPIPLSPRHFDWTELVDPIVDRGIAGIEAVPHAVSSTTTQPQGQRLLGTEQANAKRHV